MNLESALKRCRLVASVQAPAGTPLAQSQHIVALAEASLSRGVSALRLEGMASIAAAQAAFPGIPIIGLIKCEYPDSKVYITPTMHEVQSLIELRTPVIAIDGTRRDRPGKEALKDLILAIKNARLQVLADIDSLDSAEYALGCGADFLSTTLSGYTSGQIPDGPDIDLVRLVTSLGVPVLAEGRYSQRWQIEAALCAGASGVVVGGALNDPIKQTLALKPSENCEKIAAVDIGGTWMRYALFNNGEPGPIERSPVLTTAQDRTAWIKKQIERDSPERLGISSGGTIDPQSGLLWESKETIQDNTGTRFSSKDFGVPTYALNDGQATCWGHAHHPAFAGKRIAVLALGTGLGFGFCAEGKLQMGAKGDYIRLNDLHASNGKTFEEILGGAQQPGRMDIERYLPEVVATIHNLFFPEEIIVCGGVGLSPECQPVNQTLGLITSPFKELAGLYGAYALARWPI